eukprot:CAMPEP_0206140618 /NCGR_PEP_ID=MMETSP1473-20131121/10051_1 /ASSEMBLY_ACC=CAM_ASM_001109 /TAXON_ID=1461547 /ORGANISM="Stichococcus sp, Strain RCC1054" /LENGTH=72 /DNA_ID=CAMNT_0053534823 /DNA_START=157 /DNA_END=375 /DNA_ORIENTATION=-
MGRPPPLPLKVVGVPPREALRVDWVEACSGRRATAPSQAGVQQWISGAHVHSAVHATPHAWATQMRNVEAAP